MGCAGLSLAIHMLESGRFADKKILLLDKEEKNRNDRTWCFWETSPGLFESIVHQRWDQAWIHGRGLSHLLALKPYQYKLIRGIDFFSTTIQTRHLQYLLLPHPWVLEEILFGQDR